MKIIVHEEDVSSYRENIFSMINKFHKVLLDKVPEQYWGNAQVNIDSESKSTIMRISYDDAFPRNP